MHRSPTSKPDSTNALSPDRSGLPFGAMAAELLEVQERRAQVRTVRDGIVADVDLDEHVEQELILSAHREKQGVLIEHEPGRAPRIVGVLQVRRASTIEAQGDLLIETSESLRLQCKDSASVTLQASGQVDLLGWGVRTISSGLLRFAARALRLN